MRRILVILSRILPVALTAAVTAESPTVSIEDRVAVAEVGR